MLRGGTEFRECIPRETQTLQTLPQVCLVVHRVVQDLKGLQGDLCLQQRPKQPRVQAQSSTKSLPRSWVPTQPGQTRHQHRAGCLGSLHLSFAQKQAGSGGSVTACSLFYRYILFQKGNHESARPRSCIGALLELMLNPRNLVGLSREVPHL